jgi:hypothetical protein
MFKGFATAAIASVIVLAAMPESHASCVSRNQISGTWKADDQGTYVIRRLPNNVIWWIGESADDGRSWTNVFRGVYDGKSRITGEWVDVKGWQKGGSIGTLTLELIGTDKALSGFKKVGATGSGFGGSRWFFSC